MVGFFVFKGIPQGYEGKSSCFDVLGYLSSHKRGLTVGEWSDKGHGCDLRKRISELKKYGYRFKIVKEPNAERGYHNRWFLV